jgi:hypothetical protein
MTSYEKQAALEHALTLVDFDLNPDHWLLPPTGDHLSDAQKALAYSIALKKLEDLAEAEVDVLAEP